MAVSTNCAAYDPQTLPPRIRKVDAGELTEILSCGFIVGMSALFSGREDADVLLLSKYPDVYDPFSESWAPRYALEPTGVALRNPQIAIILQTVTFAKILSAVIKCVVIFMVTLFSWTTTKNEAVHSYRVPSDTACGVKALPFFVE